MKHKTINIYFLLFSILMCYSTIKQDTNNTIYVFVGKIISIENVTRNINKLRFIDIEAGDTLHKKKSTFESRFLIKSIVFKELHNTLKKDTIEFIYYNELGENPTFINDQYTLFYISKTADGNFYTPGGYFCRIVKMKKKFYTLDNKNIKDIYKNQLNTVKLFTPF